MKPYCLYVLIFWASSIIDRRLPVRFEESCGVWGEGGGRERGIRLGMYFINIKLKPTSGLAAVLWHL